MHEPRRVKRRVQTHNNLLCARIVFADFVYVYSFFGMMTSELCTPIFCVCIYIYTIFGTVTNIYNLYKLIGMISIYFRMVTS